MKVTLIAVGKGKSHIATQLLTDYIKRLPWSVTIKEVEVKQSLSERGRILKEGEAILAHVTSDAKIVVLDERGKNISSNEFSSTIRDWQNDSYSHLIIIIGGAFGLSDAVRKRADLMLSFGKMTWPHMMVRAMVGEQLYRAHTILSGHPYHKV